MLFSIACRFVVAPEKSQQQQREEPRDRVKKTQRRGPRPPILLPEFHVCRLDQFSATSAAVSQSVVVVARG